MGSMMSEVRPRGAVRGNFDGQDHVFISYSRWDQSYVSRLVTAFRAAGVSSWTSGLGRHSPAWRDVVFPLIADCAGLVVVMTPRSYAASGVHQEIRYAESLQKAVIPIALDGCRFLEETAWPAEPADSGSSSPQAAFMERIKTHVAGSLNCYSGIL
jgi:hypothetical protein